MGAQGEAPLGEGHLRRGMGRPGPIGDFALNFLFSISVEVTAKVGKASVSHGRTLNYSSI